MVQIILWTDIVLFFPHRSCILIYKATNPVSLMPHILFLTPRISYLLFSCFFFISLITQAANENFSIGGRSAGMGNASVTLSDVWAIQQNQAGLANLKNISAGIYYENKFLMKELSLKAIGIALPTAKSGVFGLSVNYFGYNLFNEQKVGLAYSKSFGDKISAGIQLDYLSTHLAEDYGKRNAVAVEVGLQAQITSALRLGVHIYNPTRTKLADYNNEKIPTIMKLGLGYSFSDKVLVCIESEKDIDAKNVFKAGLEYHIIKELYLRTGISTNPTFNTFGFGLLLKKFQLDFATSRHQTLGYTPQCSLIYNW